MAQCRHLGRLRSDKYLVDSLRRLSESGFARARLHAVGSKGLSFVVGGAQRSMNLTRTREQGHTEVPRCINLLSCWREIRELRTGNLITGESMNCIFCVFPCLRALMLLLSSTKIKVLHNSDCVSVFFGSWGFMVGV